MVVIRTKLARSCAIENSKRLQKKQERASVEAFRRMFNCQRLWTRFVSQEGGMSNMEGIRIERKAYKGYCNVSMVQNEGGWCC